MLLLKASDHFFKIGKELFEDQQFGDIIFQTDTGILHGHSQLVFPRLKYVSSLACNPCRIGHEKVVILLPGVEAEFMEIALMEFYLKGDARKLDLILTPSIEENNQLENMYTRSTDDFTKELENKDENSSNEVEVKIEEKCENALEEITERESQQMLTVKETESDNKLESPENDKLFGCTKCDKKFVFPKWALNHMKKDDCTGKRIVKLILCQVCEKPVKEHYLKQHMKTHTVEMIKCSKCKCSFKNEQTLASHVPIIHKPQPKVQSV